MKKLKAFIIKICFQIIDRFMDESQITKPDPKLMLQIQKLTEGVDIEPDNQVDSVYACQQCENYENLRGFEFCPNCNRKLGQNMKTTYEIRQSLKSIKKGWQEVISRPVNERLAIRDFKSIQDCNPDEHFELYRIEHEETALDWTGKEK